MSHQAKFDLSELNNFRQLLAIERKTLAEMKRRKTNCTPDGWAYPGIRRLLDPLMALMSDCDPTLRATIVSFVMRGVQHYQRPYNAWSADEWKRLSEMKTIGHPPLKFWSAIIGSKVGCPGIIETLWPPGDYFPKLRLARRLYGDNIVNQSVALIDGHLKTIGYSSALTVRQIRARALSAMIFITEKPDIRSWTIVDLNNIEGHIPFASFRNYFEAVATTLYALGILAQPYTRLKPPMSGLRAPAIQHAHQLDLAQEVNIGWLQWTDEYIKLVSVSDNSKVNVRSSLLAAGRWLQAKHPTVEHPRAWTREMALEFVAYTVNDATVGHFMVRPPICLTHTRGNKLAANTQRTRIGNIRVMFDNCFDWELFPQKFSPNVVFALPRSLKLQIVDDPRDLNDDVWAKLVAAAISINSESFKDAESRLYPIELVRAVAITWVFAALRVDELRRLETDCISWMSTQTIDLTDTVPKLPTCSIRVPTNKTAPEFEKPVDGLVGEAIEEWLKIRPPGQPAMLDRKTKKPTNYAFAIRGKRVGARYLNRTIIHKLCELAGVPEFDSRGSITSHRARSTIATQLANAENPMTLFELKEWLGHGDVRSTFKYLRLRAKRLQQAYANADYFRQNIARMPVLFDHIAIKNGDAARGATYKFYDLIHGFCGDRFFSRCPHRMACVKCSYYVPKESTLGESIQSQAFNERLSEEVPMRPLELAALRGDAEALESLRHRLADVPAADGRRPAELKADATVRKPD
jgi:integrase